MYQMIRCGRIKWGVIQIEKIVINSFIYNVQSFLVSIVVMLPYICLDSEWGNVIYTLSRTDAGREYGISMGFSYDVIGQNSFTSNGITMLILWLAGSYIGFIDVCIESLVWADDSAVCFQYMGHSSNHTG